MSSAEKLAQQAAPLPYGAEKVALLERAVDEAALAENLDLEFTVRHQLATAANISDRPQLALLHTTWCLEQLDRHPGRFDAHWPLWQLKWAPVLLVAYPDTSLQALDELITEVARRHTAQGDGGDAVAKLRWSTAMRTGRVLEARELLAVWRQQPRTTLSDCRICDIADEASLRIGSGEDKLAIATAAPLLAGSGRCAEEPALLLPDLLPALERVGDARTGGVFARAADLIGSTEGLVVGAAQLARWAAHVHDEPAARRWGSRAVGWGGRSRVPFRRMSALAAQAVVEEFLQEPLPGRVVDSPADAARALAAAFDSRNGNGHIGELVRSWLEMGAAAPVSSPGSHRQQPRSTGPLTRTARSPAVEHAPAGEDEAPDALLGRLRDLPPTTRIELAEALEERARLEGSSELDARARRHRASGLAALGRANEARAVLEGVPSVLSVRYPFEAVLARLALATQRASDHEPELEAARTLLPRLRGDQRREADAEVAFCTLDDDASPDEFDQVFRLFDGLPNRQAAVRASQAMALAREGDLGAAEDKAVEALALVGRRNDHLRARLLGLQAAILGQTDAHRALVVLKDGADLARDSGDLELTGELAGRRAKLLEWLGDPAAALAAHYEAVECFGSAGNGLAHGWARLELAACLRSVERHDEAYEVWAQLATSHGHDPDLLAAAHLSMALCDTDFGYLDEAQEHVAQGLEATSEPDGNRGQLLRLRARLAASQGDVDGAADNTDQAVAALVEAHLPQAAADALRAHVVQLIEAGRSDAAMRRFEEVEALEGHSGAPTLERVQLLVALEEHGAAQEVADRLPRETGSELWDAGRAAVALRKAAAASDLFDRALELAAEDGVDPTQLHEMRQAAESILASSSAS